MLAVWRLAVLFYLRDVIFSSLALGRGPSGGCDLDFLDVSPGGPAYGSSVGWLLLGQWTILLHRGL